MKYNIAKDFSRYPAGRFKTDGKYSGEQFREDVLIPSLANLRSDEKITIILDGTRGYGSSFLEEAFGGLIRLSPKDKLKTLVDKIKFVSKDQSLPLEIYAYMTDAVDRAKAS